MSTVNTNVFSDQFDIMARMHAIQTVGGVAMLRICGAPYGCKWNFFWRCVEAITHHM